MAVTAVGMTTDRSSVAAKRRESGEVGATVARRRRSLVVPWVTAAVFLLLLTLLAVRLASGEDPGLLGRKGKTPRAARQVLVRRVYERVVVVHLPSAVRKPSSSVSQQVSSETEGTTASAPVTRTS